MLNQLFFLVKNSLRRTFRVRANWFLLIGLPIIGILASTLLYSGGQSHLRIGFVNEDGSGYLSKDTLAFVQKLQHVEAYALTREQLRNQLADSKLDMGLIIEQGYSESVMKHQPGHIILQSVKGSQVTSYVKSMLDEYIGNLSSLSKVAAGDSAKFQQLYRSYQQPQFKLISNEVNDSSVNKEMSYQSIGFLILFMLNSASGLSELILKNRENRTYFRIISAPVSAKMYVLSNIIVNMIVMFIQVCVAVFFLTVVFHLDPGLPVLDLMGILTLFGLAAVGLSLVIVAFSRNTAMAGALQNFIITPTCLLAGCFFPLDIMPHSIQRIADFLPQHWVLKSIGALQNGPVGIGIWFNVMMLLAFAVVFFLLASYRFGRNNDTRNFV
ncbi:ABC-2 type transport system permease protein [Paenibacillus shirakamiensis]|uniref:Transport permease protein n=1 Tax=Paenibacillus shirakamiensis TaxID=1265935 RepID=A0ABS4JJZ5_9BACL|nr:ABC transporter permease [Paenibacillus shirakamiensis]MBP2001421.1 ABC-2 type transport system permease protein [Paenibacillus shirakamiensis]